MKLQDTTISHQKAQVVAAFLVHTTKHEGNFTSNIDVFFPFIRKDIEERDKPFVLDKDDCLYENETLE